MEEYKCSAPTSVTCCLAERYAMQISLKMDYTQWTGEQFKFDCGRGGGGTELKGGKKREKKNKSCSFL